MTTLQLNILETLRKRVSRLRLTEDDIERLSLDIWAIAQDEPEWRSKLRAALSLRQLFTLADDLVDEWSRRLGSHLNVPLYLATLRSGDSRRFRLEDSADRAERALRVE